MSFQSQNLPSIHLGNRYKLTSNLWDYPLSSIIKLLPLTNSYVLALDWYCNLHVIACPQENQSSLGPVLYPPDIATKGHPQILFTLQYLHLRQVRKNPALNFEKRDLSFFSQLDYSRTHYTNLCVIEDGKILFKPTNDDCTYCIDFRTNRRDAQITSIDDLSKAWMITKFKADMLIYQDQKTFQLILYCFRSKRAKILNSAKKEHLYSLQTLEKSNLCIACYETSFEVIDLTKNKILEVNAFVDLNSIQLVTSPDADSFVFSYISGRSGNKFIYFELYTILLQNQSVTVRQSDVVQVAPASAIPYMVQYINPNCLVLLSNWTAEIYRVQKEGFVKLNTIKLPCNLGYEETSVAFSPNFWCFNSFNKESFLVLVADERWGSLQMYLDIFHLSSPLPKSGKTTPAALDNQDKASLPLSVKRILSFKSDYIRFLATCNDQIIALTYRHNVLRFNQNNNQIERITNISGLISSTQQSLVKIRCVKQNIIALVFENDTGRANVIVLDLECISVLFNSFHMDKHDEIPMKNIEVLDDVSRIIFKFEVLSEEEDTKKYIGEIDYHALKNHFKQLFPFPLEREPEAFLNLGEHNFCSDDIHSPTVLSFFNLNNGGQEVSVDFYSILYPDHSENNVLDIINRNYIDSVKKINNQTIALYYSSPDQICIYNWQNQQLLAKCVIEAQNILRPLQNSLLFVRSEDMVDR